MPADGPRPEAIVSQARTLKAKRALHDRVPLQVLADELHVHVRILRAAAHDGRLAATFGPPVFWEAHRNRHSRGWRTVHGEVVSATYRRGRRRLVAVCRVTVPANYAATLVRLRHRLGLSQQQLAVKVSTATAVVT